MKKRFLVTSAGGTDPYTLTAGTNEYNDGSILSILRKMKKDQKPITDVYLYLSLEMGIREFRNQVFSKSIKSIDNSINIKIFPEGILEEIQNLCETNNITQEFINKAETEELERMRQNAERNNQVFNEEIAQRAINVDRVIFNKIKDDAKIAIAAANKFGIFYPDFYKIMEEIRKSQEKKSEVYINVSSGTPAIEMDLDLISLTVNDIQPIIVQVSNPTGASNSRGNRVNAIASDEELKQLNEIEEARRKTDDYKERAKIETMEKTRKLILLESLEDSFAKYDYAGVYDAINSNKEIIKNPLIKKYATNLYFRYIGVETKAEDKNIFVETDYGQIKKEELYPIFDDNENLGKGLKIRRVLERINIMKVKAQREEINDWLLLTQTVLESLYKKLIYKTCGLNLDNILNDEGGIDKNLFNEINKNNNNKFSQLSSLIPANKTNQENYLNAVTEINILNNWWENHNTNKELQDTIKILDMIRRQRNLTAHTEIFITHEMLNSNYRAKIEKENAWRRRNRMPILNANSDAMQETINRILKILNVIVSDPYKEHIDATLNIYETIKNKILNLLEEEIRTQE